MNNLDADFKNACDMVKFLNIADSETQLMLYALYKQATTGDFTGGSSWDPVTRAKQEAWKTQLGRSSEEAKFEYINLVNSLRGKGFGNIVSRPVYENEEVTEDPEIRELFELISHDSLTERLEELLNKLGVNIKNTQGVTPLHTAVDSNQSGMASYLVNSRNADTNAVDDMGMTPVHYAALLDNPEILMVLLGVSKTDLTLRDSNGDTAEDLANEECLRILSS